VLKEYSAGGIFGEDREGDPVYHCAIGNLDFKGMALRCFLTKGIFLFLILCMRYLCFGEMGQLLIKTHYYVQLYSHGFALPQGTLHLSAIELVLTDLLDCPIVYLSAGTNN